MPAVAVGKVQEYAVAIVGSVGVTVGVVVVQTTEVPDGLVTVQAITPAGFVPPVGPVTTAVNVVVPPRVGPLDATMLIVGTSIEMPNVTEFEVPAK